MGTHVSVSVGTRIGKSGVPMSVNASVITSPQYGTTNVCVKRDTS